MDDDQDVELCGMDGCQGPTEAEGLCRHHLELLSHGDPLDPQTIQAGVVRDLYRKRKDKETKMANEPTECRVPGCDLTPHRRGVCKKHYDHRDDPGELFNRWDDPEYREVRERLLVDLLRYRACPPLLYGPPPEGWRPDSVPGYEQADWCEEIKEIRRGKTWSEIVASRRDPPD